MPVQGRDVGLLVGVVGAPWRASSASGPGLDLSLSAAGGRPDCRSGGVLQREARHQRRRSRVAPATNPVQLADFRARRTIIRLNTPSRPDVTYASFYWNSQVFVHG